MGGFDELMRIAKVLAPAVHDDWAGKIAHWNEQMGMSFREDVLSCLGQTWVLSGAASQGGFLTGTLLTVQVIDEQKLSTAIAKMMELWGQPSSDRRQAGTTQPTSAPAGEIAAKSSGPTAIIKSFKVNSVEIHYLAMPAPSPIAPAWAVHNSRLYMALWPQVVAAGIENTNVKSLKEQPAFRAARGRITANPAILTYINTPAICRKLYPLALLGRLGALKRLWVYPPAPTPGDKAHWPAPLNRLEKYLWPRIQGLSFQDDGVVFEDYGSTPPIGLIRIFHEVFRKSLKQAD